MFIKLRAERFQGRLTAQERGAGLGDIFTQNILSAIRAVCQVLGPSLCGQGRGGRVREGRAGSRAEGRHSPSEPPHHPAAGRPKCIVHLDADGRAVAQRGANDAQEK